MEAIAPTMALLAEFDGTPSTKTRLSFNLSMGNCCRKLREEQPEPKSPIAILKRIGEKGNFNLFTPPEKNV